MTIQEICPISYHATILPVAVQQLIKSLFQLQLLELYLFCAFKFPSANLPATSPVRSTSMLQEAGRSLPCISGSMSSYEDDRSSLVLGKVAAQRVFPLEEDNFPASGIPMWSCEDRMFQEHVDRQEVQQGRDGISFDSDVLVGRSLTLRFRWVKAVKTTWPPDAFLPIGCHVPISMFRRRLATYLGGSGAVESAEKLGLRDDISRVFLKQLQTTHPAVTWDCL
jgi:hypothetical protein